MSEPTPIKTGGPAFPWLGTYLGADGDLHPTPTQYCGLTMRDYFAAKAMQALITSGDSAFKNVPPNQMAEVAAVAAYQLADAMLAERNKDAQARPHRP